MQTFKLNPINLTTNSFMADQTWDQFNSGIDGQFQFLQINFIHRLI